MIEYLTIGAGIGFVLGVAVESWAGARSDVLERGIRLLAEMELRDAMHPKTLEERQDEERRDYVRVFGADPDVLGKLDEVHTLERLAAAKANEGQIQ